MFLYMKSHVHFCAGKQDGNGLSIHPVRMVLAQPECWHESCKPLNFVHVQLWIWTKAIPRSRTILKRKIFLKIYMKTARRGGTLLCRGTKPANVEHRFNIVLWRVRRASLQIIASGFQRENNLDSNVIVVVVSVAILPSQYYVYRYLTNTCKRGRRSP